MPRIASKKGFRGTQKQDIAPAPQSTDPKTVILHRKTLLAIYSKRHFCIFKIYLLLQFSFNPLEIWNTSSWSYDLQINWPVF